MSKEIEDMKKGFDAFIKIADKFITEQHSQGQTSDYICPVEGCTHLVNKPKDQPCDVKQAERKDPSDEVSELAKDIKEAVNCGHIRYLNSSDNKDWEETARRLETIFTKHGYSKRKSTLVALDEKEHQIRAYLWLNHGHKGIYGDDGEMQCSECLPNYDYKRMPLLDVVRTAIASICINKRFGTPASTNLPSGKEV